MSNTKPHVDATCDRSMVSSAKIKPPLVFSACLNGKTKILQPVGFGNLAESDFKSCLFSNAYQFFIW
jgi:hypothetical protein